MKAKDLLNQLVEGPHDALRHHVTGAIERGEKQAIVGRPGDGGYPKDHSDGSDPRTREPKTKYPELDEIALDLSDTMAGMINKAVQRVQSRMPYKAQYTLEKVIEELKKRV